MTAHRFIDAQKSRQLLMASARWRCGKHQAVCFLATHIADEARLDALVKVLKSIKAQTTPAILWISWSAEAALEPRTRETLAPFLDKHTTCFHQRRAKSQFQHYRFLAGRLDNDQESKGLCTWVLFSDDDDVWHPMRLQFYCMLLESSGEQERDRSQAVTCPWWAIRADGHETLPPASRAEEVEDHLREGKWIVQDFSHNTEACEHWCSLVRLERVLAFYEMAPDGLVGSRFCDVAFARFFGKGHDEDIHSFRVTRSPQFPWLYAYNASPELDVANNILRATPAVRPNGAPAPTHASADAFAPTKAEEAAAVEMLGKLRAQFADANPDASVWAVQIARQRRTLCVVAATRLWIPSTVALRGALEGPAYNRREKAEALAQMCFSDLEVIWRTHQYSARERALALFCLDVCGGVALRLALREFGFENADAISDAFTRLCATLRDAACQKACGFVADPSKDRKRPEHDAMLAAATAAPEGAAVETPAPLKHHAVVARGGGASLSASPSPEPLRRVERLQSDMRAVVVAGGGADGGAGGHVSVARAGIAASFGVRRRPAAK